MIKRSDAEIIAYAIKQAVAHPDGHFNMQNVANEYTDAYIDINRIDRVMDRIRKEGLLNTNRSGPLFKANETSIEIENEYGGYIKYLADIRKKSKLEQRANYAKLKKEANGWWISKATLIITAIGATAAIIGAIMGIIATCR